MVRSASRALAALLLVILTLVAWPAAAQNDEDRALARSLGQGGLEALAGKRFETAAERFARADALFPAPTLKLGLARAKVGLGRLVAAQEIYNRIVTEGARSGAAPAYQTAVEDARVELAALVPRIAHVTLETAGAPQPQVLLDGLKVPPAGIAVRRPIDPGQHQAKAWSPGFRVTEVNFSAAEGDDRTIRLELISESAPGPAVYTPPAAFMTPTPPPPAAPAPASPPPKRGAGSPLRTLGAVAIGVGGLGLVVGVVSGIVAAGAHSDLEDACKGGKCLPEQQDDADSFHTSATIADVGLIAGAAVVAIGVVLIVVSPSASAKPKTGTHAAPRLGARGVGVSF